MIHKYKMNNINIVLDVDSSTVHVLDDASYDLIDYTSENMPEKLPSNAASELGCKYSAKELEEAWTELYGLFKGGLLHSDGGYDKYSGLLKDAPIKSMCLNIAHDCNLRCRYCFASTGDFGGGRKLMPFDTAKNAIDFLIANSGTRRNLELDFFGGEPLMNFDVVKKTVEYARSIEKKHNKNFRFTITTNGILLDDDKIDFINKEMSNVVMSIDGRKRINDAMRVRPDGTGCYDQIIKNFKRLCEKRGYKDYYVRGTFTRKNLDFSEDVMHLWNEGFDQISVEPVIADEGEDYAIQAEDLPRIFEEYEKLAKKIIEIRRQGGKINFFHFMIDLDAGPCVIKLLKGCGCGNEYVAVTPDGDIYPCHQFVGRSEWKMGSVNGNADEFNRQMKNEFANAHILSKPKCKDCWAKFFCGGGCNANNNSFNNDIRIPPDITCELERKRTECAIMIKAALSGCE